MARKTIKNAITLGSWAECDEALRKMGENNRDILAAENVMNEQIASARKLATDRTRTLIEQNADYAAALERFALAHRGDFGNGKTKALNFGSVSFRQSTRVKLPNGLSYADMAEEIEAMCGERLSTSAIGRHAQRYMRDKKRVDIVLERMRIMAEYSRDHALPDVSRFINALIQDGLMRRILDSNEEFDEMSTTPKAASAINASPDTMSRKHRPVTTAAFLPRALCSAADCSNCAASCAGSPSLAAISSSE